MALLTDVLMASQALKNHLSQELTTRLKTAVPLLYHPVLIYITKQDFIWINKHTCQIFLKKKSKPRLYMATILHKLYSNNNFPFLQSSTNITPNLDITTAVEMWHKVQRLHKSRGIRCAVYIQEHPLTMPSIYMLLNCFIAMVKPVLHTGILFYLTTFTSHYLSGYFTHKTLACSRSAIYDTCLSAEGKHFQHLL